MRKLKAISALAAFLIALFIGYFFLNMPSVPLAPSEPLEKLDTRAFYADTSSLKLPENMHISASQKYNGKFYIADAIAKKVYCIDENSKIIWESSGEDKFILPNLKFPLSISEDGNLWVANTGKRYLEQLNLETGAFIAIWQPTEHFKGCCNPIAILALSEGRFLAMEKGTALLKLYYADGSGKTLEKLEGNWQNYELRKIGDKIEYCDGSNIKTLTID